MPQPIDFDPYTILGLGRNPTPEQVRDAYRTKSKKHHPDHGGDEWAFRIVVRAYELLGGGRSAVASVAAPRASQRTSGPIQPTVVQDTGQVRRGVHDQGIDPTRIVAVEIVWMRFEVEDVTELLSVPGADRNLSGSIHLIWPDPELSQLPSTIRNPGGILLELNGAYESLKAKTRPHASHLAVEDGQFEGWISYPSGSMAWEAFRVLHISLKLRTLGVRQWTRDLTIPRDPVEGVHRG
jgi:hypothetical protein